MGVDLYTGYNKLDGTQIITKISSSHSENINQQQQINDEITKTLQ